MDSHLPLPSQPGAALAQPHAAVGDDVFRALFAAYPDALLVANAQGAIMLANPSAAALLGYADGELVGLSVDVLVPDSSRPRHADYRHAYGKNPRPRPMSMQTQLVAKCKDGTEVMVEIALSPVQGSREPLVVAAIRDIGAYPRVKQALQRARYSECLAELGQLAVDARATRRWCSPACRRSPRGRCRPTWPWCGWSLEMPRPASSSASTVHWPPSRWAPV